MPLLRLYNLIFLNLDDNDFGMYLHGLGLLLQIAIGCNLGYFSRHANVYSWIDLDFGHVLFCDHQRVNTLFQLSHSLNHIYFRHYFDSYLNSCSCKKTPENIKIILIVILVILAIVCMGDFIYGKMD